jgi:hypothetical protein
MIDPQMLARYRAQFGGLANPGANLQPANAGGIAQAAHGPVHASGLMQLIQALQQAKARSGDGLVHGGPGSGITSPPLDTASVSTSGKMPPPKTR